METQLCHRPAFPSEAVPTTLSAGLRTRRPPTGSSFPVRLQSMAGFEPFQCSSVERSFLFTAAGQFRSSTGIPFSDKPRVSPRGSPPKAELTIS
jgi:hypothetical protein